jgi:hypothetical protein
MNESSSSNDEEALAEMAGVADTLKEHGNSDLLAR